MKPIQYLNFGRSIFFKNLIVVFLYAITGYLGLFLALPPGYATAIWPPSGIALGAAVVWGLRVIPGIFLGSFFLNFYTTSELNLPFSFTVTITGIFIALGAVLQTIFGWILIKRWINLNNYLFFPSDILLFAFLSGPVSCLVNATWSNSILLLLGILTKDQYLLNWSTWWIGDSIGVLIFTPMFLILFAQPTNIWHKKITPILIPLIVSFFTAIFLYTTLRQQIFIEYHRWEAWSILTTGLLFCILMNIILFVIDGQKNLAQFTAQEKTYALAKEEELNLLLLKSAGEGIYGIDKKGLVTFINPTALKMLGYEENELIGQSIHDLIHHSYANGLKYPREKCPVINSFRYSIINRVTNEVFWRKNGTSFWAEYTSTPIKKENKTVGCVVVFNDITKRRKDEIVLKKMANTDPLTHLPNRVNFYEQLTHAIERAQKNKNFLAVCFIDMNNFKQINDTLGHNIGDQLLKAIANIYRQKTRESDFIARLGGDEFGLILENINSINDIRKILNRYLRINQQSIKIEQFDISTSISVGVAIYSNVGESAEDLIKNADMAMYQGKETGNNVYFFDETISRAIKRKHLLDSEMQYAIFKNQLRICYQPQFEIASGLAIGVQAVFSWQHPTLGEITSTELITSAERNGFIHKIGEWFLTQACQDYPQIAGLCRNQCNLSIPVTGTQLKNNKFIKTMENILQTTGMETHNLILEITEKNVLIELENIIHNMKELIKKGIHFSLDDFGVSYSSLNYLKNLPVDQIKIAHVFIRDIPNDEYDETIVRATIELAQGLNKKVIADGVENVDQLAMLKKMKCNYAQGPYFSEPVSKEMLAKILS